MNLKESENKKTESEKKDWKIETQPRIHLHQAGKMRTVIEDGRKAVLECSQAIVLM